jgi:hypothetical protein
MNHGARAHIITELTAAVAQAAASPMRLLLREFCSSYAAGNDPAVSDEIAESRLDQAEDAFHRIAGIEARSIGEVWMKMRAYEIDASEIGESDIGVALHKSALVEMARLCGIDPHEYSLPPRRNPTAARLSLEKALSSAVSVRGMDWYRESVLAPHGVDTSAALTTEQLARVVRRLNARPEAGAEAAD